MNPEFFYLPEKEAYNSFIDSLFSQYNLGLVDQKIFHDMICDFERDELFKFCNKNSINLSIGVDYMYTLKNEAVKYSSIRMQPELVERKRMEITLEAIANQEAASNL